MSGIHQMLFGGGDRFTASAQSISHGAPLGQPATAGYRVDADGQAYQRGDGTSGGYTAIENWLEPPANAGQYEVQGTFGTPSNGGTTSGPAGWQACTADQTYEFERSNAASTVTLTVDWRRAGDTNVLHTVVITLTADGTL